MPIHDTEISERLRTVLADRIGSDRCDLWFGSIADLSICNDRLIVSTQNEFSRDLVRSQFASELQAVADAVFSVAPAIEFIVEKRSRDEVSDASADASSMDADTSSQGFHAPSRWDSVGQRACQENERRIRSEGGHRPRMKRMETKLDPPRRRRPDVTFNTYITGIANALAATSARHVVDRPGRCSPLLFFGPTATGKTHLLEAIRTEARHCHPRAMILFMTAEQFTSSYVEALQHRRLPGLRHKLRGVDFLLVDDIQFFAGKQATLAEFQNTLDSLIRDGKQVVLTTDRPLRDLAGLGQDLVSRLSGGLVCEIESPDYETRLAIVRAFAMRQGLVLSEDVLVSIATNIASNAREIRGALYRLHATSVALGEPINRSFTDRMLAELAQQNRPPVGLPEIEQAVCEVFGVAPQALRSKRTAASLAAGRTLAMWLARKYTRSAMSEIGYYFGRRSHSTVISAGKRITSWISNHRTLELADRTCQIEEAIRCVEDRLRRA
ncbi:MAG: chromosomal replication initiator protein DnaA [Pirellulales bacterium]|nr:chromosomal replication initiator protein DnaA [Pirellulales bacterium]